MALDNLFKAAKADRRNDPQGFCFDTFTATDGVALRFGYWPHAGDTAARGSVIFLPGRTEFIEKFYEDMTILQGIGFATAAMDFRGQGLSQRPFGDINKHELESFDPHVTDVRQLFDALRAHGLPEPFILMAHSAGSHVTLRTLHDFGGQVAGAVTVAPMCRIATGGLPRFALNLLPRLMTALGFGSSYVPGHTAFREGPWGWRKQLTHCDDRFRDEDHFIAEKHAGLAVGGATFRWVDAANRSCDVLMSEGYGEAITRPVLMLQAGHDTIVDNQAQHDLVARMPNAELVTIDGAKHELLKETDEFRAEVWAAIQPFLDRIAPEKGVA